MGLLNDAVYLKALRHLCADTKQGVEWRAPSAVMRPSSGFIAVVFALQACRNVSLFGFTGAPPCAPHHYYDPPPPACSATIPPRYDHPFHWFEKEHAIYADWERHGAPGGTHL